MYKYETNPENMWKPSSKEQCRINLELIDYLIDVYVSDGLTEEQMNQFREKYDEILELCKNPNTIWKKDTMDYITSNSDIIQEIKK
jgi:hypothetical protein